MSDYSVYIPKSKGDPERAVIPALLYASDENEHIKVQILTVGWWRWGIAVKRVVPKLATPQSKEGE